MEKICAFNNTVSTKNQEQQDIEQIVDKNDIKQNFLDINMIVLCV
jgi:hypothetical protein